MVKLFGSASLCVKLLAFVLAFSLVSLGSASVFATTATISPSTQNKCAGGTISWSLSWGGTRPFKEATFDAGEAGYFSVQDTYATGASLNNFGSYANPGTYGQSLLVKDFNYVRATARSTVNVNCF